MEHFCRALHPDLDLSPTCVNWFRQASEHCTGLILGTKDSESVFWKTVKNFIFPEHNTDLVDRKIRISVHPKRLSLQDCHSLFLDVVNDYIVRAPRYSVESATNTLLWKILYSLMGIMALGSLLVTTIFGLRKLERAIRREQRDRAEFSPESCLIAASNRSLRIAKCELDRLHVRHLTQPEELFAPDGTKTLVLKMSSKLKFLEGIVAENIVTTGRMYRIHEQYGLRPKKPEYKTEATAKILRFLSNYTRKLRIMLIFDEDPVYEELLRKRKKSPTICSSPKSVALPSSTPRPPSSRMSTPRSASPLTIPHSPKSSLPARRSSPHLNSPRPHHPTQIPRTCQRFNSSFSLKK